MKNLFLMKQNEQIFVHNFLAKNAFLVKIWKNNPI
jgi:hypothetical protein